MTIYAEAVLKTTSQKHLLFEVEPAEELWSWTLTDGQTNTYEIAWSHLAATDVIKGGLYRLLIGVEEDGVALTERANIAAVESNAGSYCFHDISYEGRDFDGINDYYNRDSGLIGAADSKVGLLSLWLRIDGGANTTRHILYALSNTLDLKINTDNEISLHAENVANDDILVRDTTATYAPGGTWYHVVISWNLATATVHFYINDVSVVAFSGSTTTNDTIDYTVGDWAVGATHTGINLFNGAVRELYFANEYLDISVEANRRKFITSEGLQAELGSTGEVPTGTQPILYVPDGDPTNNRGSGGDFEENGSPEKLYVGSRICVHTSGSADPDTVDMMAAFFRLHFSTTGLTFNDIYYEKRILADTSADMSDKASDLLIGRQRTASGTISLDNTDKLFDKLSAVWNWKNKAARVRFGLDDIALTEYATARELLVDDIAPTEQAFTLELIEKVDVWRRRFPITPHFGSGLGEGVIGTRVPVLYGQKTDIIPDLVDDEDSTPNEWVYRIADHTKQQLYSVDTVYAINRSSGNRQQLTLTTHYTVNLTNCTITINDDWTVGGIEEVEEVYEIRCDAKGISVAELSWGTSPTSADYLKWPGEIAKHILLTYLSYAESDLDLPSFTDADTAAPFALGFWVKGETTVREVLRVIEKSSMSYVRPKKDGTIEYYVWDPWTGSAAAIELSDEDFSRFKSDVKITTVYYKTQVRYDENPAKLGSFQIETVTATAVDHLNKNAQELTIDTYLRNSSDAQLLAQRINFLYQGINIEYNFTERGIRLMNHELNQRVRITKTRAPTASGVLTSRLMEVLELDRDFVMPQVSGRLGDLKGLADIVGKWTATDAPTWSAATDEEKADSGFWCNASGLADATDPNSKDVSLWW